MAKKSVKIGDYTVTINENASVEVDKCNKQILNRHFSEKLNRHFIARDFGYTFGYTFELIFK